MLWSVKVARSKAEKVGGIQSSLAKKMNNRKKNKQKVKKIGSRDGEPSKRRLKGTEDNY